LGYSHFDGLMAKGAAQPLVDNKLASAISTAGAVTYTVAQFLGGLILRDCNGAGRADVTPTAAAIIAALFPDGLPLLEDGSGSALTGQAFRVHIRNTTGGAFTITLTAGTGVTISGTATIAQNNAKDFLVVITGATTVTIYSLGTVVF
jgi:hypothetical protein